MNDSVHAPEDARDDNCTCDWWSGAICGVCEDRLFRNRDGKQ